MNKKMKVVWLCHLSNCEIRKNLKKGFYLMDIIRRISGRKAVYDKDSAIWNSNALKFFERFDDIELSVIMPHRAIKGNLQDFSIRGIHFYCFRSEDDYVGWLIRHIWKKSDSYSKNRAIIKNIVSGINPDIIHVIGAENPYYSYSALDISDNIPTVVSLQTLMSEEGFYDNYFISKKTYVFRSQIEKAILQRCNYIASPVKHFKEYVIKNINPNAIFMNMPLALGVDVDLSPCEKRFDFVYFAANISKAVDYAIEAFALAHKSHPEITLNISGGYSPQFKKQIDKRISELGIQDSIIFSGSKKSHSDVIKQIKQSRFALLPLKVDLISGTIREAMACGLPVITTVTPATPDLNIRRESVLLSDKGDFMSMASNMIRLIENNDYSQKIKENAILTIKEEYSNENFMNLWHKGYYCILDNFNKNIPIPNDLLV